MLDQLAESTLTRLGPRLRAARQARHLSQAQLAEPEYTNSYVSAVERGRARPSLRALELLAGRLALPVSALLLPPAAGDPVPDLPALETHLADQLDQAALLINADQATS